MLYPFELRARRMHVPTRLYVAFDFRRRPTLFSNLLHSPKLGEDFGCGLSLKSHEGHEGSRRTQEGLLLLSVSDKSRQVLLKLTTFACGVLGLILFRWTPTSGKGIVVYAGLFVVLIIMVIVFLPRRRGGYWPDKPGDQG